MTVGTTEAFYFCACMQPMEVLEVGVRLQPSVILLLLHQIRRAPESGMKKAFAPRYWGQGSFPHPSSPLSCSGLEMVIQAQEGYFWPGISSVTEDRVNRTLDMRVHETLRARPAKPVWPAQSRMAQPVPLPKSKQGPV